MIRDHWQEADIKKEIEQAKIELCPEVMNAN
jgi:hypothetical protein